MNPPGNPDQGRAEAIPLTGGGFTLVSPDDADLARRYTWFNGQVAGGKRYAMRAAREGGRKGKSRTYYLHRVITKAGEGEYVDHINGDGLDNRRENLRLATAAQNCANRRSYAPASGFRGVYAAGRKWLAEITVGGRSIRLGRFESREDAARRYDEKARESFGEFAVLNFPEARA